MNDLLDLDTLVAVKKAAPQVTVVPFDLAREVVNGMCNYSQGHIANDDPQGMKFWTTTVKSLSEECNFEVQVTLGIIGRTLKAMGIESWRKTDGFHIAWSQAQLDILVKHFKKLE